MVYPSPDCRWVWPLQYCDLSKAALLGGAEAYCLPRLWSVPSQTTPYALCPSSWKVNFGSSSHLSLIPRARLSVRLCHGEFAAWRDGEGGVMWEADAIAKAVGGQVRKGGAAGSISTDTRTLARGQWFLALVGPNFDGHNFLQEALNRGCAGVIGVWVPDGWPRGFVQVEMNTLKALQDLAVSVRARYPGPVVGITGSSGKTTTRTMIALALQGLGGHVHETQGNLNNLIGVPLTLLRMPSFSSACVLEMGMSLKGELIELAEIAKPQVRVVLNVGPAHMEYFPGGLMEVAAAKGEIFQGARPGDVCVVNADDLLVMSLPIPPGVQLVYFGAKEGCHMRLVDAQVTKGGLAVRVTLEHSVYEPEFILSGSKLSSVGNGSLSQGTNSEYHLQCPEDLFQEHHTSRSRVEFEILSPGLHLASNACAAAAVAITLGVPLASIGHSLSQYKPVGMRCRVEEIGPYMSVQTRVINDCYNANPASVAAGLQILHAMQSQRHVAVLGDMLELGTISQTAHEEVLHLCQELALDLVLVAGPCFSEAAKSIMGAVDIIACHDAALLAENIIQHLSPGDAVLVKGSRGMKMEVIVDAIKAQAKAWSPA